MLRKKDFIFMNIWAILKSLKNNYHTNKSFVVLYSSSKTFTDKDYEHVLKSWNKFEMKTMKEYCDLHLKCNALLAADVFVIFSNSSLKNMDYVQIIIRAH